LKLALAYEIDIARASRPIHGEYFEVRELFTEEFMLVAQCLPSSYRLPLEWRML